MNQVTTSERGHANIELVLYPDTSNLTAQIDPQFSALLSEYQRQQLTQ